MSFTTLLVFLGLWVGWWLYARSPINRPAHAPIHLHRQEHGDEESEAPGEIIDVLASASPTAWKWLAHRLYFDELYAVTVLRWYKALAWVADWLDRRAWAGLVSLVTNGFRGLGWVDKRIDSQWIDGAFDKGCEEVVTGGGVLAWLQAGRSTGYLRLLVVGVLLLVGLALVVGVETGQVRL